jgi:hypothetical protein
MMTMMTLMMINDDKNDNDDNNNNDNYRYNYVCVICYILLAPRSWTPRGTRRV